MGTSTITITGVNFTGATAVTIGGTNVSSFVVNSDTQITTTIGNGTTGLIEVVTPFGLAVSSSSFTVNALPTANISGATTGCGSVSLTATGGNVYAWSGGSSSNLPVNTFSISNIYTVTVTDSNNCSATASASVNVALPSLWYEDLDGDGYGNAQVTISDCIQPANYVSNNTDCNDADNSQWQSAGLYVDADNDGYDAGTATVCYGTNIPAGYKATTLGSDCDDTDANRNVAFSFYADTDGDGFGSGNLISGVCAVNSSTAPAGYSTNNTDCTPTNGNTWQLIPGYIDADSDSFTVGSIQNVCSGSSLPPGYIGSTLGNDEDDNNPSITTGIIDLSGGEGSVNIYPNPTSRALSVNFGNGHSYNHIQLTDATGKLLYETSISASTSEKQINAADLSEGVYFLVLSGSKHHKTLRFVKQ